MFAKQNQPMQQEVARKKGDLIGRRVTQALAEGRPPSSLSLFECDLGPTDKL